METGIGRAYEGFRVPVGRYVRRVVVPVTVTALAVAVLLWWLLASILPVPVAVFLALPVLACAGAVLYPVADAARRRGEIDHAIHLYVTHMAVLATANIPRVQILDLLGGKHEYKALAEETRRIHTLVASWNMSLADACRLVAAGTPSRIFADFLDRFAYSLESGEDLGSFLANEQVVVMADFAAAYRGRVYALETMKHLYNSVIMSLVFLVVFATLLPVLTGLPALPLLAVAGIVVVLVEAAFVLLARERAPRDAVWHMTGIITDTSRRLRVALAVAVVALVPAALLAWQLAGRLPPGVLLAIVVTPLAYAGWRVGREEERIHRRDLNFPAFVRSMGASVSARGGAVGDALRLLRHHDFGPLTGTIRGLHARLAMRCEHAGAWGFFGAESGSHLVESFSRIFTEGLGSGGRGDEMGRILSDNAVHLLTLRKERAQTVSTLRGLLAGLAAGVAFALHVGVGVVGLLQEVTAGVDAEAIGDVLGGALTTRTDVGVLQGVVALLLLAHCAASAGIMHYARGGHPHRALGEFVAFTWLAAVAGALSSSVLTRLL